MFKKSRILKTIILSLLVVMLLPWQVYAKSLESVSENTIEGWEKTDEAHLQKENDPEENEQEDKNSGDPDLEDGKEQMEEDEEETVYTFTVEDIQEYITDENILLPESAAEARAAIVAGLKAHADYIDLSPYGITYNEFYNILHKDILYWEGSLFYVTGGSSGGSGDYVTWYRPSYIENEEAIASVLKRAVRECVTPDMNDLQKALALHNWLATHCTYDHEGIAGDNKYRAYGALVMRTAVCEGYTAAYTMLARYAGLEVGTASGGNHKWNQVKIDGQWYNVDVTWDGQEGFAEVYYGNFMVSDSRLRRNHTISIQDNPCTSTIYDNGGFWGKNAARRTDSAVVPINGTTAYALSYDGRNMKLLTINMATGAEQVVRTFNSDVKWGTSYYAQCSLLRTGGRTYFNDARNIYQIEDNGNISLLWTYGGSDGRLIYGIWERDGGLEALVGNSESMSAGQVINVPLPESVIPDITAFVKRLYTVCLGRNYDSAGLSDWVSRLNTHRETAAQVAYGFFFGEEFKMKNLSDREYVEVLYRTMFDREGDPAGMADWLDKLENGMSRLYVYRGFAESQEFQNLCDRYDVTRGSVQVTAWRDRNVGATGFIARLYTKMLGRSFDEDGLEYWCHYYLTGQRSIEDIASDGFLHSEELRMQNLSDEEFVKRMYRTFLNREAEADGLSYWLLQLRTGAKNRDTLVYGFTQSPEFAQLKAHYGL